MPAFEVYKPDHAQTSRWILGGCAISLATFGCYSLFHSLGDWAHRPVFGFRPLGDEFVVGWALIAAAVFWIGAAYGVWRAVNYPKLIDFLGETEIEMTKVAWSSRREVVGSSMVVIATVIILGVWIAVVTLVLSQNWGGWLANMFGRIK